jgi:hypothetical protein
MGFPILTHRNDIWRISMAQMKTSDLKGSVLDWAVTAIEQPEALRFGVNDWIAQRQSSVKNGEYLHRYHQSWAQGGPIIERGYIGINSPNIRDDFWEAHFGANPDAEGYISMTGPTPLIAAMRCFVASKLGDEVDVPEELV